MNAIHTSNDDKEYLHKQPKIVMRDDILYSINETEKTANIFADSARGDIFIPRTIKYKTHEYVVTKILKGSFYNSFVKSIKFPSDSELKTIEENSFDNSKLASITLPPSVSELTEGWCCETSNFIDVQVHPKNPHFKSCNDEMILSKSNKDSEIFDVIIFVNRRKKMITIPSQIKEISAYSFERAIISKIDITQKVTKICKYAFLNCHQLNEINFPIDSELKTIEEYAFDGTKIKSITIPSSVCELKDFWCSSLNIQKVTLMPNNPYFKNYQDKLILGKTNKDSEIFDIIVFAQRNEMKSIEIPPSITIISPYSFAKSVFIPKNVTQIKDYAFDIRTLKIFQIEEGSEIQLNIKKVFGTNKNIIILVPKQISDNIII